MLTDRVMGPATPICGDDSMLTGISTITVHVTDQDKALEFYTQKLGFEVRSDQPMGPKSALDRGCPSGCSDEDLAV